MRSLANDIDTIVMVGKGNMSEQIIKQADDALTAREIIKGKVLESSELSSREILWFRWGGFLPYNMAQVLAKRY